MIWAILIAPLLIGLLVIRYTYQKERNKWNNDRKEAEKNMKDFMDMLNQKPDKK
ncbi:MAG TPA: hypothetical protein PKD90_18385 [Phnomibacter sp.]|nr:hypothetical protein [Phnomibacter sp.]